MVKTCAGCVDFSTCVKDQRATRIGCKFYLEQNARLTNKEEAPLRKCTECKHRTCTKSGKLCTTVEKMLPKLRSGGHSKEFSSDKVEILYQLHRERESGGRKKPHILNEKWDED
jgi:hypothetical protein